MTIIKGVAVLGSTNIPYPTVAAAIVAATYAHTLKAAPVAGDIIEIGCLPQGCKLVDAVIVADDLDTGAALTFDVGIMTGEFGEADPTRTCGNEILAASTIGQAGGVARPTKADAFRIPTNSRDRGVGVKIGTVPAGFQAGTITVILQYNAP